MKLHPIKARNLRLPEIGQFIIRYFTDMESSGIDLTRDSDFYAVHMLLKSQSSEYQKAMKQIKAMAETRELETLDRHRDYKIATLRRAVSVFEYSDTKEEQDAYRAAKIIMDNYTGLETENYEAQTFNMHKLLGEWAKPEYKETIELLGLKVHLAALKKSAAAFDRIFSKRSNATIQKTTYDSLGLKKQMMGTYGKLVRYVSGIAAIKTNDADYYYKILDAINNGRKYFSDLLAKRNGNHMPDIEITGGEN
jgi:hypothetical protein